MTQTPTQAAPVNARNTPHPAAPASGGGSGGDKGSCGGGGFVKLFLPGLILGLVIGGVVGAVGPTFLGESRPPLRPTADRDSTVPPMTRAEREAVEAAAEHLRRTSESAESPEHDEAAAGAGEALPEPAPASAAD